jgi:hypothetical protein
LAKIEKMNEAKKKANNYLRRGPSKTKVQSFGNGNSSEPAAHQNSSTSLRKENRSSQRVNQQKVIQEKLFERYNITSQQSSNQKEFLHQP